MNNKTRCLTKALTLISLAAALLANAETVSREHSIQFPEKVSLGPLLLIPEHFVDGAEALQYSTRAGSAQGKVRINVPAGKWLMLDANRRVFGDSKALDEINPPDIDALKLGCMGTDDSELGLCDSSLKRIPRFKHLQYLDIDTSDATDTGLANVLSLSDLKSISMVESRISGRCFKDFGKLSSLRQLIMDRCMPNQSNLSYLHLIPNLTELKLRWSNIGPEGMKGVAECSKLKFLDVSRNRSVDDKCVSLISKIHSLESLILSETGITDDCAQSLSRMKNLKKLWISSTALTDTGIKQFAELKNLQELSMWNTRVTIKGLQALKNLKLTKLVVSRSLYQSKRKEFATLFPHVKFEGVDANNDLGPLKKMFVPI